MNGKDRNQGKSSVFEELLSGKQVKQVDNIRVRPKAAILPKYLVDVIDLALVRLIHEVWCSITKTSSALYHIILPSHVAFGNVVIGLLLYMRHASNRREDTLRP